MVTFLIAFAAVTFVVVAVQLSCLFSYEGTMKEGSKGEELHSPLAKADAC